MNTPTQIPDQPHPLVDAIVANVLRPNNHELLRHLGKVLGLNADSTVLLISKTGKDAKRVLKRELGCKVDVYDGSLHQLPFDTGHFDSAIVAVPVSRDVHAFARELSRVLKPKGMLGMVVFSIYQDQVSDRAEVLPLLPSSRPAAAYRAVLAESGFTAFVSEDRRRDVLRSARDNYRQHLLQGGEQQAAAPDTASQALGLLATGGVGLTLITAEKGF